MIIISIMGHTDPTQMQARMPCSYDDKMVCVRSVSVISIFEFSILRASNPNKSIVDVFLTRCRISMCQGLGPKKHDEISEIDRSDIVSSIRCSTYHICNAVIVFIYILRL